MRFIIYGAGAVGGSIGGRLAQAGHEVALICRGAHLEAVRQRGLLLRTPEGDHRLPVTAVAHPRELAFTADDVVVLTMKTQHTEAALLDLETSGGADVPVVCTQNGVENERLAARRFPRVYAMLVALPATHLEPGEVIAEGTPLTGVLHAGRWPEGTDETIEAVCAAISSSTMLSEADPQVMRLKYAKLLSNLGNAFQVITNVSAWGAGGEVAAFMRRAREEAMTCYRAAGIDWADEAEYRERVGRHFTIGPVAGADRAGSSTMQSVLRGHTTTEVDALNGEIVLLGRQHGIPTPVNAILRRLAVQMAAAGDPPGRYTLADLEAMLDAERPQGAMPAIS